MKLHLPHSSQLKSHKKSQKSRNQGFSYYFCLKMEGSGSVPLTNGSGRPKNIRIRNTGFLHFWRGPCSVKILDSAWKCSERREVIFFTQIWTLLNYRQCAFILSIRILKKTKIKLLHLFIAHTRIVLHAGLGFYGFFFAQN